MSRRRKGARRRHGNARARPRRPRETAPPMPRGLRQPRLAAIVILLLGCAAALLGPPLLQELEISGSDTIALSSESAGVAASVERAAGVSGQSVGVLVPLHRSARDPRTRNRMIRIASPIARMSDVRAVNTYIGTFAGTDRVLEQEIQTDFVSFDGRWTYLTILFDAEGTSSQGDQLARLRRLLAPYPGVKVGGATVLVDDLTQAVRDDIRLGEILSLPVLLLILLWFFRKPYLALLPLIVGLFTLLESLVLLRLMHKVGIDLSLLAIAPIAGLALGLSVDYNLLFVTRYREEYELLGS